jgi:hypothetical protein
MVESRPKLYHVRRTLDFDGEGIRYQFLAGWRSPTNPIWQDERMDCLAFVNEDLAQEAREVCRSVNSNLCVSYHAVVEA